MADPADAAFPIVRPGDAAYAEMLRAEAAMWASAPLDFEVTEALVPGALQEVLNEQLTGDRSRTWFEDLAGRGPFEHAALLGSTGGYLERRWIERGLSRRLDVYELSRGVLARLERRTADLPGARGLSCVETDLNVATLPAARYDIVWSPSALHHLVSLEHVFASVRRALRPGGLFAFFEYVGEPRIRFSAERLRRSAEALTGVPEGVWREGLGVRRPAPETLSPFEALRSGDLRGVAEAQFERLHWGEGLVLTPGVYAVDLPALATSHPDLVRRFADAEREARARSGLGGCIAYGVFRPPAPEAAVSR